MIKVLRQYYSFDIIDSRTHKITLEITMKITEKQPFFLLPVSDYRADLQITDSEGKEMIILPDREFENIFKISMKKITESFLEKLKNNSSNKVQKVTKNYRVIAVMLNQEKDEYYEKVKISWNHSIEIVNYSGKLVQAAKVEFFIPRYGFEHNVTSAIYFSVKTDGKYKIMDDPEIRNMASTKFVKPLTILDNVRHKVYRFQETDEPQLIQIKVMIGLPKTVVQWASIGVYVGTFVPIAILLWTVIIESVPKYSMEIMAGVLALLAGERVLVLRDIPLMKKLSRLYVKLFGWCIAILVILMILSSIQISTITTCDEKSDPCELVGKIEGLSDEIKDLRSALQDLTTMIKPPIFNQNMSEGLQISSFVDGN